jgi:hypothetical protein
MIGMVGRQLGAECWTENEGSEGCSVNTGHAEQAHGAMCGSAHTSGRSSMYIPLHFRKDIRYGVLY